MTPSLTLITSEGEKVEIPQFYRKGQKRLKKTQQKVSRRQKGSKRYQTAVKQLPPSFPPIGGM